MHKKRRNLKGSGCIREMNRSFCDMRLREVKSGEVRSRNAVIVEDLELSFGGVFGPEL